MLSATSVPAAQPQLGGLEFAVGLSAFPVPRSGIGLASLERRSSGLDVALLSAKTVFVDTLSKHACEWAANLDSGVASQRKAFGDALDVLVAAHGVPPGQPGVHGG
jgi:hypothetical protein